MDSVCKDDEKTVIVNQAGLTFFNPQGFCTLIGSHRWRGAETQPFWQRFLMS